jgi:LysR family hca operon transcriptional activator
LLVRSTNSVTLTEAGENFYEEAREILAHVDQAVQRLQRGMKDEVLRVGYSPSFTVDAMPRAIGHFHAAAPRVRLELSDLSTGEMIERASGGQLDVIITPPGLIHELPEFAWTELHRLAPVVVAARTHPFANLKRIPPLRLRDQALHGLNRTQYPEYARQLRALLKPFQVTPRLLPHGADGIVPLFATLEAENGVTVLHQGVSMMLPPTLVILPFFPALESVAVQIGSTRSRPNSHAEIFTQLLIAETRKVDVGSATNSLASLPKTGGRRKRV